ncbi:uncharacterized protein J7T54_005499 [Emericellopsis cladophorae]|uniref:Dynamin N-terminal domain-containing protein n=1 Tax=Emericellopsis cladophorae TaxID=2686198 RepID=A0A9Q0BG95_9HYPO|nr:uncharacterized protein J7T54_005499 [Emericellopsis cladophorae]KAI6783470.1 hypothetical protein J7T54_005499 [Emericellopsis cladophorae]
MAETSNNGTMPPQGRAKKQKHDTSRDSAETTSFAWDIAEDKSIAERIALKETAVENAVAHVDQLTDLLEQHADDAGAPPPLKAALKSWIAEADETLQSHRNFQVLVGVVGQTGVGKTSLLNAMLGEYELLPSGHERAATAVCCKVAWNYDMEPGHECRAEVFFQDLSEIKLQILGTLQAIKSMVSIANDTSYLKEDERINDTAVAAAEAKHGMDKIRAVWNLDEADIRRSVLACGNEEKLADMAQTILQTNPSLINVLKTRQIELRGATGEDLAKQIKPYLDATTSVLGGSDIAMWPLICNVNVYIRSEILRHGICLVDLPGVGDAVESRVKVASDFHKKLEVTMIVAAIQRAADERTTLRLLNDSQEMRARLTAGTNQHAFGVVLTKMDDLDINSYVKRSRAAEHDHYVQKHMADMKAAQEKIASIIGSEKFIEKANKRLASQLKKLKRKLKTDAGTANGGATDKEIKGVKSTIESGEHQIGSLREDAKPFQGIVDNAMLHLRHWATVTRNTAVAERMQEGFVRRQRRTTVDGDLEEPEHVSTLAVHATSSQAFWRLRNGNDSNLSFPTERYTGVPQMIQWICKATAERREKHLDVTIQRLLQCMNSIDNWSKTCQSDLRINVDYKGLQEALKQEGKQLLADSAKELRELFAEITSVDPFENLATAKRKFRPRAKIIASRWHLKFPEDETSKVTLRWNSYLAVVKRKGGPYSPAANPDIEYDWIPKLYRPIILDMSASINHSVNTKIPALWDKRKANVKQALEAHFKKLTEVAQSFDATLSHHLDERKSDVVTNRKLIFSQITQRLDAFRQSVDVLGAAHAYIFGLLRKCFEYMETEITGQKSYLRRREYVEQFVGRRATDIFNGTVKAMSDDYKKKKKVLKSDLEQLADELVKRVSTGVFLFIDNLLGDCTTSDKLTVQSRVQDTLAAWRKDWQSPKVAEHMLLKDVRIPPELLEEDLKARKAAARKKKNDEDDSDDDDSSDESSDESSDDESDETAKVKTEGDTNNE